VGSGPLEKELRQMTDNLDLQATVHFTGYRQDALSFLSAADVFALPGSGEPFGLALVEAMGLGVPVVAADDGGPREIVEHGVSGVLTRPSDSTALAEGILSLLGDRDYAARLARAGRQRARALFSAGAMARQTAIVYREAVEA
jgi:glycosyltransferase involved in cell wall biosynthesis